MSQLHACALGVRATLVTPRRIEQGLADLMSDAPSLSPRQAPEVRELQLAVAAAHATTRVLGAVPGLPWQRTCLYRAAAECIARRSMGQPAFLCLGARPATGEGDVEAHAWVEATGPERSSSQPDGYTAFRRATASRE